MAPPSFELVPWPQATVTPSVATAITTAATRRPLDLVCTTALLPVSQFGDGGHYASNGAHVERGCSALDRTASGTGRRNPSVLLRIFQWSSRLGLPAMSLNPFA